MQYINTNENNLAIKLKHSHTYINNKQSKTHCSDAREFWVVVIKSLRSSVCQHVAMVFVGCAGLLLENYHSVAKVFCLSACCYGVARVFWMVAMALSYSC